MVLTYSVNSCEKPYASARKNTPPFCRVMVALSASHSRAADSTNVWSTDLRSKVERLMTLSTSAVAVCCCRLAQFIKQTAILNGDHRLVGESLDQLNLLLGKWADYAADQNYYADRSAVSEERYTKHGPHARK